MVSRRSPDLRAAGDDLTEGSRVFVVTNPASGRGRGRRRIAGYRELLARELPGARIVETTRPGEEADLADQGLEEGFEVIVAVGGDGTWSNVADRVVASAREDVTFGLLPSGTGNDFGRNLGFSPSDAAEAVRVLAAGVARSVDVGRLETPTASEHDPGRSEARHFLNVLGFGFDVAVIDAAAGARFLRGELLYKMTALQQLFRFPGLPVGLAASGAEHPPEPRRRLMVTISNGRFFGGGFPIAPGAAVDDGRLHACLIDDASPMARLSLFNRAERGRHTQAPEVTLESAGSFTLRFAEPPRFELDGDVRTCEETELRVRSLPGALRVIAPSAARTEAPPPS